MITPLSSALKYQRQSSIIKRRPARQNGITTTLFESHLCRFSLHAFGYISSIDLTFNPIFIENKT